MNDIVIKVENVSKQYRLGEVGTGSIKDDLKRWRYKLMGREDPFLNVGDVNDRTKKSSSDYVWALKDINFEVKRGDVLGIIGKNGAGKSTLLKILSRTTGPSIGTLKMKGRTASLLEVGTGFHPELTGRDNIFLNGAIMGLRKFEIKNKLDEIVAFSGVERYLDTPVKRYSSGMYIRLAFAVAAHLEPEILIVDEVLAVGDAEFQKKCLGKIKDVKGEGRTVIFVSHNMAAVKSLCNKGIVLKNGQNYFYGDANTAITKYFSGDNVFENRMVFDNEHDNEYLKIHEIQVKAKNDQPDKQLDEFDEIDIFTEITIKKSSESLRVVYVLNNDSGEPLFTFSHDGLYLEEGKNKLVCSLPKGFLNTGDYFMDFYLIYKKRETLYKEKDIISFKIQEGVRPMGVWMGRDYGFIKPVFDWKKL